MQLSGQNGSGGAAQVTHETIRRSVRFSWILAPNFAPLIREPETIKITLLIQLTRICKLQDERLNGKTTHTRQETSRSSAETQLRAMETQSLSAPLEKQVANESTQKAQVLAIWPSEVSVCSPIFTVNTFTSRGDESLLIHAAVGQTCCPNLREVCVCVCIRVGGTAPLRDALTCALTMLHSRLWEITAVPRLKNYINLVFLTSIQ